MKKIISLLLAISMLLPMLCISAGAASKYKVKVTRSYGSGYTYVKMSSNADAIYYTTDGSKPDSYDKKYTKKLKLTKPCTLRIAAYENGKSVYSAKISVKVRLKAPTLTKADSDRSGMLCYKVSAPAGKIYYTTDGSTPTTSDSVSYNGKIYAYPGATIKAIAVKSGWKNSKVRTAEVPEISSEDYADEVLRLVNEARAEAGLSPLKTDPTLTKAAMKRAEEQLELYGHTRPDGSGCFTVFGDYGLCYRAVGENVAAGYATPEEVVNGWLNSSGHRANIMSSDYQYIGIGYAYTDSGYRHYWAQLFWKP